MGENIPEVVSNQVDSNEVVAQKAPKKDAKKVEIQFIASPTGKFNLAYSTGETASFPVKQAAELIELGLAIEVK